MGTIRYKPNRPQVTMSPGPYTSHFRSGMRHGGTRRVGRFFQRSNALYRPLPSLTTCVPPCRRSKRKTPGDQSGLRRIRSGRRAGSLDRIGNGTRFLRFEITGLYWRASQPIVIDRREECRRSKNETWERVATNQGHAGHAHHPLPDPHASGEREHELERFASQTERYCVQSWMCRITRR